VANLDITPSENQKRLFQMIAEDHAHCCTWAAKILPEVRLLSERFNCPQVRFSVWTEFLELSIGVCLQPGEILGDYDSLLTALEHVIRRQYPADKYRVTEDTTDLATLNGKGKQFTWYCYDTLIFLGINPCFRLTLDGSKGNCEVVKIGSKIVPIYETRCKETADFERQKQGHGLEAHTPPIIGKESSVTGTTQGLANSLQEIHGGEATTEAINPSFYEAVAKVDMGEIPF
jgi:hypothetical protein